MCHVMCKICHLVCFYCIYQRLDGACFAVCGRRRATLGECCDKTVVCTRDAPAKPSALGGLQAVLIKRGVVVLILEADEVMFLG